ncbi:iron-containing redox enzyme family protein [Achromobacter xylosoxidans]
MHDAYADQDAGALAQFHRALFDLYNLHVAGPTDPGVENQFSMHLAGIRASLEQEWLRAERARIGALAKPMDADGLIAEIKAMWRRHPASQHPLFDALQARASIEQLRGFFKSDAALNIRFFDLIVMALIGSEPEARTELATNFWDEAGRGNPSQSHVTLYRHLLEIAQVGQAEDDHASGLTWQGLRGHNLFMCCAINRRHYFRSLGVMAITELLDPDQYTKLIQGCRRVGLADDDLTYYIEHAEIDIIHGDGWLEKVIRPIVDRTPSAIPEVLEGCALRLATCGDYYDDLAHRLGLDSG